MFDVVAAVIKKKDKFLIAQRNRHKHLAFKWEFPGGKVETNETHSEALKREIKEELNISINILNKISEQKYIDKEINIILHYYLCTHFEGEINLTEHENYLWINKKKLKEYDLTEGDNKIINLL